VGDDDQGVIAGLRLLGPCVEDWTGSREDRGRRLVRESMVTGQGEAIRRKPDLVVGGF
jgi:hypothetical protein